MLASFEKTADHLFDAAYFGQKDSVCGKPFLKNTSLKYIYFIFPSHLYVWFQVCPSASSWESP